MITIHDLKVPEAPAVVDALTRVCGLCNAPKGEFCRPITLGGRLTTLVHIARATAHLDRRVTEWRPVVGFEGHYEVSDNGQVRGLDRTIVTRHGVTRKVPGKMRSTPAGEKGYPVVSLRKDGRLHLRAVHRLVLEAFVGPRPDGYVGCHYDGDPANNNLSNLRWDTPKANMADALRHGTQYPTNKTTCDYGHPLDELNTYHRPGIQRHRECRTCRQENSKARQVSHREQRRSAGAKLYVDYSDQDIADMRAARAAGESYRSIAERYPLSGQTVRRICLDLVTELRVKK